jgi:hypothetical protein
LTALAPTVLSSARPADETLAALRAAGYAPVGEDPGGAPLVERAEAVRAPAAPAYPRLSRPRDRAGRPADPQRLARALLAAARAAELADRPLAAVIPLRPSGPPSDPDPRDPDPRDPDPRDPDAPEADAPETVATAVDLFAWRLEAGQRRLLTRAIELGAPVRIDYTDAGGFPSTRLIEPLELDRHLLTAWCHLREDERVFALDRIGAVLPG